MLNKKKKEKVWCDYEGTVPDEFAHEKRFRCPLCKKNYEVYANPCSCCNPPTFKYRISQHKKFI